MNMERELRIPFWEGNTIYDESVLFLSENGKTPDAPLFFRPVEILRVCSSDYATEYVRGVDWEEKDGMLYLPEGSAIPYMKREQLHFYSEATQDFFKAKDGGKILYKTKGFFHKQQTLVTYRHRDQWAPSGSVLGARALEKFREKVARKETITLCFYGDSITAGCDCSKLAGVAPFRESWPTLVTEALEQESGCRIRYVNTAVGGKRAGWGLECVQERVVAYDPDLVVLAFGMNDGTDLISPEVFRSQILDMKQAVLERNPNAEFVLIATTVANPESIFDGCQREYLPELIRCMDQGDVLVNMTQVHDTLLTKKRFVDMTGNNINHPNDFLIRVYAQMVLHTIHKAMNRGDGEQ